LSRRARLWRKLRVVGPLLVVTMLFRGSQNMAQTTMSILGHERLHLDPATIGAVMAGSALCGVAASAVIAPHVPLERRPLAVAAGVGGLAIALCLFATAPGLTQMVVAAGLLGVGGGLTMPLLTTMAGSWGGPGRDRDLALYTMALSLSLAVGPLVEALVLRVSGQSLTTAFLVFTGFPVAAVVLLSSGRRRPRAGAAGFFLAIAGAWFVIGPLAWRVLEHTGAYFVAAAPFRELTYQVGSALGPGLIVLACGALAMGWASRRPSGAGSAPVAPGNATVPTSTVPTSAPPNATVPASAPQVPVPPAPASPEMPG